eukprot:4105460-Lingulodinium_polyedra.AAC.1
MRMTTAASLRGLNDAGTVEAANVHPTTRRAVWMAITVALVCCNFRCCNVHRPTTSVAFAAQASPSLA